MSHQHQVSRLARWKKKADAVVALGSRRSTMSKASSTTSAGSPLQVDWSFLDTNSFLDPSLLSMSNLTDATSVTSTSFPSSFAPPSLGSPSSSASASSPLPTTPEAQMQSLYPTTSFPYPVDDAVHAQRQRDSKAQAESEELSRWMLQEHDRVHELVPVLSSSSTTSATNKKPKGAVRERAKGKGKDVGRGGWLEQLREAEMKAKKARLASS